MASPIGHALVGLAAAGVTAEVTGTPETPALWIGAVVAAGVPDLDLVLALTGRAGPRYHRNHSHAVPVLVTLAGVGWFTIEWLSLPIAPGLFAAWTVALLTHPALDVVTSGPDIGARGFGIPLWWPFSRHRVHAVRDLFDRNTAAWGEIRNAKDLWWRVRPEVMILGPVCGAILLIVALL